MAKKVVYQAPCGLEIKVEDKGPELVLCMQTDGPVNEQGYVVKPHPDCDQKCLERRKPEQFYRYVNGKLIPIEARYCLFYRLD